MKLEILAALLVTFFLPVGLRSEEAAPLCLVKKISLMGTEGRMDHLAVDLEGKRLFLAALGHNSVEVVSLETGKAVQRIYQLKEPQGVAFVPGSKEVVIACGKDGSCRIYDAQSLKLKATADYKSDADNVRLDPSAQRIYVGYGKGALGALDLKGSKVADVKLEGHPESFQLEKKGKRIFVNVPAAGHVAVVDREKLAVIATWPLKDVKGNYPMALDEDRHRLFVGCRSPSQLLVLDTDSGQTVASVPASEDTDDVFYDPQAKRIYMSCGAGFIDVFEAPDADHYKLVTKVPTALGARTSLFVPELKALYLAVPHIGEQQAEIRVYEPSGK
jgi:DNA-binding beta-propeller fold protein YncE